MIADQEANRERVEKAKREEEERMKKEREEQEKLKRIEEEKKLAEMAAAQGLLMPAKPKYTKLRVLVGSESVFQDVDASRFIFKILRERVSPSDPSSESPFNPDVLGVLKDIYDQILTASSV